MEYFARFDEQPDRNTLATGDRGKHRRRNSECARIAHDDCRQQHHGCRSPITDENQPSGKREARDDEHDRPVVIHEPVGEQLQRRLALGDAGHQPNDLGEKTFLADFGHADLEFAVKVQRAADHLRAAGLRVRH